MKFKYYEKKENQTTVNTEDYDFIYSQKYTAYLSKKNTQMHHCLGCVTELEK